MLEMVKVATAA